MSHGTWRKFQHHINEVMYLNTYVRRDLSKLVSCQNKLVQGQPLRLKVKIVVDLTSF